MKKTGQSRRWFRWLGFSVVLALLSWFPWVLTLFTGVLVYFPYHEDGESRFLRVAGPVPGIVSSSSWSWDIPRYCRLALVAAEDTGFFEHHGVERQLVEENAKRWQKGRRVKAGGSTITQQLVKNAFLSRQRTAWRKAREVAGALILDAVMPKEWQLSWYLNIVEFAPETYGIENAAQHYFKKRSRDLRPNECAALVSILPNPKKWGQSLSQKSMSPFLRKRYGHIVYRTDIMGLAAREDIRIAKRSGPFGEGVTMPFFLSKAPSSDHDSAKSDATSTEEFPDLPDDGGSAAVSGEARHPGEGVGAGAPVMNETSEPGIPADPIEVSPTEIPTAPDPIVSPEGQEPPIPPENQP